MASHPAGLSPFAGHLNTTYMGEFVSADVESGSKGGSGLWPLQDIPGDHHGDAASRTGAFEY